MTEGMVAGVLGSDELEVLSALERLDAWVPVQVIREECPSVLPRRVQYALRVLRSYGLAEYRDRQPGPGAWRRTVKEVPRETPTPRRPGPKPRREPGTSPWADTGVKLGPMKEDVRAAASDAGLSMGAWIILACREKLDRERNEE